MEDEDFKNFTLARMTSRVVERFLAVLDPFISQNSELATLENLKRLLNGIFSVALDIKIMVMLSSNVYECIWPAPGAAFQSDCMETERSKYCQDEPDGIGGQKLRVRLALVPGLRGYQTEKARVDSVGFKTDDESVAGESSVLAKSVVLL